jgi:hypothetical protein
MCANVCLSCRCIVATCYIRIYISSKNLSCLFLALLFTVCKYGPRCKRLETEGGIVYCLLCSVLQFYNTFVYKLLHFLSYCQFVRFSVTSHTYRNTALIKYQIKIRLQETICTYLEQKTLESRDALIPTYMEPFRISLLLKFLLLM